MDHSCQKHAAPESAELSLKAMFAAIDFPTKLPDSRRTTGVLEQLNGAEGIGLSVK